jgi:hypothetical protein
MNRNEGKQAYPVLSAADWISLAAAPTFAIMALLGSIFGGGPPDERLPFGALAEADRRPANKPPRFATALIDSFSMSQSS